MTDDTMNVRTLMEKRSAAGDDRLAAQRLMELESLTWLARRA
jgi:hypothetical protein